MFLAAIDNRPNNRLDFVDLNIDKISEIKKYTFSKYALNLIFDHRNGTMVFILSA